jgi:hypothetical protein
MIEILELINSPKAGKRFRIVINEDGVIHHYDFGAKNGSTYIDHQDKKKRAAFQARHLGNPIEAYRIHNLIPSPALFAFRLLWGSSTDLLENVISLQKDFNN